MKRITLTICIVMATVTLFADRLVFDMPKVHSQHIKLLALMNEAHRRGDYSTMDTVCYQGIKLQTDNNLWTYNLACALSLQENKEEAIEALKEAIRLGFHDLAYIRADSDLKNLHGMMEYQQILDELQKTISAENYTNSAVRRVIALAPNADNTVMQAETNTIWDFGTGLFHTFIDMHAATNAATTKPPEKAPFLIYVNRDNGSSPVDTSGIPGILQLTYCREMKERSLHIGSPNTLFINENTGRLIPAIGNSSMGFINSAYWRCQPRALFNDPERMRNQIVLLLGNQLYCYPTYSDYRIDTGDLFSANTPYYIAAVGNSKSEQFFVKSIAEAIAALSEETRVYLETTGLLMPTMQMLLRKSQRAVTGPQQYLSGIAHPAAFQPEQLDKEKLVQAASELTTDSVPPLVLIRVENQTKLNPELDMPTCVYSETLFNTQLAAARVFRAFPRKRIYKVKTLCRDKSAKIRCVLLQGDPEKVSLTQDPEEPGSWIVGITYHHPFKTPVAGGKSITTTRVDIGFFAETQAGISLPSILSCYFLGNEMRIYDGKDQLVSIDYRRHLTPYTDPLLSFPRNWKDKFKHDKEGRITGWSRIRPRKTEQFTAYGDLAIEFDDKGRATKARRIAYTRRYIGSTLDDVGSLPSLAQVDDNIEVRYTYESDDDYVGRPEKSVIKMFEPPAHASE